MGFGLSGLGFRGLGCRVGPFVQKKAVLVSGFWAEKG